MPQQLTARDFSPYLHQSFDLCPPGIEPISTELIEVTEWGPIPQDETNRRPFSLLFRGPFQPILPQQIYSVSHAQMGRIEIFLVPIGPDAVGMRYQAIFA